MRPPPPLCLKLALLRSVCISYCWGNLDPSPSCLPSPGLCILPPQRAVSHAGGGSAPLPAVLTHPAPCLQPGTGFPSGCDTGQTPLCHGAARGALLSALCISETERGRKWDQQGRGKASIPIMGGLPGWPSCNYRVWGALRVLHWGLFSHWCNHQRIFHRSIGLPLAWAGRALPLRSQAWGTESRLPPFPGLFLSWV